MTNKPAVAFETVTKSFGTVRAVDGVDLTIRRGETVALLGRNGAGKSTSIGLLLGLDEPDSGRVRLFGDAPAKAVRAGRVGAMLQEGRAVPRVTVGELLAFVARAYPAPMPVAEGWGRVRLTVSDNGRGTDDESGPGSGLTGLRERVAAAGGTLESGPAPRGGFRVVAELPVEAPASTELEPAE